MMVGGRFAIDDELRLLIYMASNMALAALTFSHIICRLHMLHVIQSLNPIRPDFFSHSPGMGEGGGESSEAQMTKIKLYINRLK